MKKSHILKAVTLLFISTISFYSCGNDDEPQLAPAKFSVDKTEINFGEVAIPNQKDLKITITNTGEQDLDLDTYTLSGSNTSEFSFTGTKITISNGKSQEFTISFTPKTEGTKTAILSIKSNYKKFISIFLTQFVKNI